MSNRTYFEIVMEHKDRLVRQMNDFADTNRLLIELCRKNEPSCPLDTKIPPPEHYIAASALLEVLEVRMGVIRKTLTETSALFEDIERAIKRNQSICSDKRPIQIHL